MEAWVGPAIVAATIAALVSVAGWFVTAGQAARSDRRRRAEKTRDLLIALRAEIRSELANLARHDLEAGFREVVQRTETDPDYVVILPQAARQVVFEAMLSEIHILPETVIDPVILYMRQYAVLAGLAEDMRGVAFRKASPQRRIEALRDFLALRSYLRMLATDAEEAIDTVLNG